MASKEWAVLMSVRVVGLCSSRMLCTKCDGCRKCGSGFVDAAARDGMGLLFCLWTERLLLNCMLKRRSILR